MSVRFKEVGGGCNIRRYFDIKGVWCVNGRKI